MPESCRSLRVLVVATTSQSLALQSPASWRHLRALGAHVVFAAAPDAWTERLPSSDDFVPLPAARGGSPRALLRLLAALRSLGRDEWDLVFTQSPIASAAWRVVAPLRLRRRTVYVVHGFHFHKDAPLLRRVPAWLVEWLLHGRAAFTAVVAAEDLQAAHRLGRFRTGKSSVRRLPGAGVDLERFSPGAPHQGDHVLYVGELNRNKRPDLALDALLLLRVERPALTATFIGEGPLLPALLERFPGGEVPPWLTYVPRTSDVAGFLRAADVLVLPSLREGLPRVIVEALAAAVWPVATDNRGSRELLRDGVGEIVPRDADEVAWARAIARGLGQDRDVDRLRSRAQEYGETEYLAAFSDVVRAALETTAPGSSEGRS